MITNVVDFKVQYTIATLRVYILGLSLSVGPAVAHSVHSQCLLCD